MSFQFFCPHCNCSMETPDELEGQSAECPQCHQFIVPVRAENAKPVMPTTRLKLPAELHSENAREAARKLFPNAPVTAATLPPEKTEPQLPGWILWLYLLSGLSVLVFAGTAIAAIVCTAARNVLLICALLALSGAIIGGASARILAELDLLHQELRLHAELLRKLLTENNTLSK